MGDLERAIALTQSAVDEAPADFPGRASLLHNLGTVLRDWYTRTGELDALERAVEAHSAAAAATRDGSPARPLHLDGLGIALFDRHRRTGDQADLDSCIEVERTALDAIPAGSILRSQCLNALGNALRVRALLTGSLDDLAEAVEALADAVATIAPDSPRAPIFLSNLGLVHAARHSVTRDARDLNEAVDVQRRAADSTPRASLLRPWTLAALADSLRQRYEGDGDPADLEAGIAAFRESCTAAQMTQTEQMLASARAWATWATARRCWYEAVEAYGLAVLAARKLFQAQLTRHHKEVWLRETRGVHAHAGHALAMAGDARAAAQCMEDGRAMLLSEALDRDRADLERLATLGRADLANRYREAGDRLLELSHAGDLAVLAAGPVPSVASPAASRRHDSSSARRS